MSQPMDRPWTLPQVGEVDLDAGEFWTGNGIDLLPKAVQYQMFDASINHGYRNAAKMLQRAVVVDDDGIIGNKSLAAIGQFDGLSLAILFNHQRLTFYTNIKTWNKYGKGWSRRVADNLKLAIEDSK